MAKNYKAAAEKMQPRDGETADDRERRIKNEHGYASKCRNRLLRNVRAAALDAVRECRITIKPDRYPDGALFKETAYGVAQRDGEDRLRLSLRQPVARLGRLRERPNLEARAKRLPISSATMCGASLRKHSRCALHRAWRQVLRSHNLFCIHSMAN